MASILPFSTLQSLRLVPPMRISTIVQRSVSTTPQRQNTKQVLFQPLDPSSKNTTCSASISPSSSKASTTTPSRPSPRATNNHSSQRHPFRSKTTSLPTPPHSSQGTLPVTSLPYHIHRTPSNQLPVYTEGKAGGSLHQTKLRKIDGDLKVLQQHLTVALEASANDVRINWRTGHVFVKGWRKPEIEKFLEERKF